ncbi:uncharacterized protein LOC8026370 [Ixodes scapularis]|uniref:uncharacterized protein LOC8026370 n=1 Tax=Ixodes scapularis TaxID=6945 RepID=UPI001C392DAC|nr:uncharacterized protein LOC8026370 [Ixodes scapularis]
MYYSPSVGFLEGDGGGVYLGGCTTTSTTATASSMSHSAAWDPTTSSLAGQGCLSSAWVHRVPENMPWALCSTPPQEQQVVRFTAPVAVQASAWEQVVSSWGPAEEVRPRRQLKRHAQVPEDSLLRPCKQLITEEKMVAQMSELSLDTVDMQLALPQEGVCSTPLPQDASVQEPKEGQLLLCPELQQCVAVRDPLLPIMEDMRKRASMALVVWQPKVNLVDPPKESKESGAANTADEETADEDCMDL